MPAPLTAGEMKSTKIARFLNQFYSGKACASAVKIGAHCVKLGAVP